MHVSKKVVVLEFRRIQFWPICIVHSARLPSRPFARCPTCVPMYYTYLILVPKLVISSIASENPLGIQMFCLQPLHRLLNAFAPPPISPHSFPVRPIHIIYIVIGPGTCLICILPRSPSGMVKRVSLVAPRRPAEKIEIGTVRTRMIIRRKRV